MAKSAVPTTTTTNKKRKSTGGLDSSKNGADASNKRRKTLDAFFSPQVNHSVATKDKDGKGLRETISLNEEQSRVLQMAVNEGKNVFFTGAAGELSLSNTDVQIYVQNYTICTLSLE